MVMIRQSTLSFVLIKLRLGDRDHFMFEKHSKWGDWGLVGGHAEPGEEGNWLLTATREANEELAPLRAGSDFVLSSLLEEPITWGPVPSRSAGGQMTKYTAQYFVLSFRVAPERALKRLMSDRFLLVPQAHLENGQWEPDVADTLAELARTMFDGLSAIPLSWSDSLNEDEVHVQVRPFRRGADAVQQPALSRTFRAAH
jgi:8-oxo-dGTP pyrophosphatase MutT (NUDIX family)